MHVSELWIYPIKSCRGIPVSEFALDDRGPEMDRRFMLVDRDNVFMTAREHHRMVLIDVHLGDDHLIINAPGMSELLLDTRHGLREEEAVIWNDTVLLSHVDDRTDRWFSDFLLHECRLMAMPASTRRPVDPKYAAEERLVSLADGYPMLLIGTGSLALLNSKLHPQHPPISMKRFRPNVVVEGTRPHEEDEWKRIQIGDVECRVVKPCSRCVLTTVDPETAEAGKEPLRTLSTYRRNGSSVLFGQNLVHETHGTVRVGDQVSSLA